MLDPTTGNIDTSKGLGQGVSSASTTVAAAVQHPLGTCILLLCDRHVHVHDCDCVSFVSLDICDLFAVSSELLPVAYKWRRVGLALGLDDDLLSTIHDNDDVDCLQDCLLYTSPSPRD